MQIGSAMRWRPLLPGLVLLSGLAACSSSTLLESRAVVADGADSQAGLSYYLPKKLVRLSVWSYTEIVQEAVLTPDGAPVLEPDGAPKVNVKRIAGHFATYGGETIVPDLRHEFRMVVHEDSASDDQIQIEITEDGFLKRVSGVATDRTRDVVGQFAALASLLIQVGPSFEDYEPTRDIGDPFAPSPPRLVASYEFDPTDAQDLARVQEELRPRGVSLTIERQSSVPTAGDLPPPTTDAGRPGVCYRLPIPYRVSFSPAGVVERNKVIGIQASFDQTVLLPNEAVCKVVPVTRTSFVDKRTELLFANGMLTKVTSSKPSELLGFVQIPVDVARAIVAIPAELLTLRINRQNQELDLARKEAAAATAETQRLDAMQKLFEAIQEYEDVTNPLPAKRAKKER